MSELCDACGDEIMDSPTGKPMCYFCGEHRQRARIAAVDSVARSNSGRGANPEMMIAQASVLAEWIMETSGAGPSAARASNPPPSGPVGEAAATADDPTSAPHRSIPRDQYVWAYEKIDCLRVISPYMGDTHDGIDAARRWYADEYADYPDYRGLRLYRLVPVEVDPEPTGTRVCGRCKRTIRPDEPAETALLGTVTDDAKHWTVEMLVCGDCAQGVATRGSDNATGPRTVITQLGAIDLARDTLLRPEEDQ